jgi:beta-galactosidase
LQEPLDPRRFVRRSEVVPALLADEPSAVDAAVARAIEALDLPTYACDPEGVFATLHEDDAGNPRVLFVLNPSGGDVLARVTIGERIRTAVDCIDEARFEVQKGQLEVRIRPRTVRFLALE